MLSRICCSLFTITLTLGIQFYHVFLISVKQSIAFIIPLFFIKYRLLVFDALHCHSFSHISLKNYSENNISDYLSVGSGVPQGSILSPMIFLIYNNVFSESSSFLKLNLFAGDSTLSIRYRDVHLNVISENIYRDLILINMWILLNKIKVSMTKRKFIVFSYITEP